MRILLIDDSLAEQGQVGSALIRAGHTVVGASSVEEAIQALIDDCVHLVILDATVPLFNDLHFLELLREDLKWTDLPVVVLVDAVDLERIASLTHLGIDLALARTQSVLERLPELIGAINPSEDR